VNDNEKPSRDLEAELRHFTGSQHYFRHNLMQHIIYTEGARHLAKRAGAYWLLDEIAFAQTETAVRAEEFQAWTLKVDREKSIGVLSCTDGDKGPGPVTVFTKAIDYTDFPLAEITLWFANNTIYLPSEH
jgi:hypothetical protein